VSDGLFTRAVEQAFERGVPQRHRSALVDDGESLFDRVDDVLGDAPRLRDG
jgi:hypothetical protein